MKKRPTRSYAERFRCFSEQANYTRNTPLIQQASSALAPATQVVLGGAQS